MRLLACPAEKVVLLLGLLTENSLTLWLSSSKEGLLLSRLSPKELSLSCRLLSLLAKQWSCLLLSAKSSLGISTETRCLQSTAKTPGKSGAQLLSWLSKQWLLHQACLLAKRRRLCTEARGLRTSLTKRW